MASTTSTTSRSSASSLVIFSIVVLSLFLFLHSSTAYKPEDNDIPDGDEDYQVDYPFPNDPKGNPKGPKQKIKKGEKCYPWRGNICNGISVNDGAGILQCCRKQCVNLLADSNNCGGCGKKCRFGQECCFGLCTYVVSNAEHCGACGNQCSPATICENRICGYA